MKIETVGDYAYPCMLAENSLKEVHQLMLANKYDDALVESTIAITYIADMMAAIKEMKERNHDLHTSKR